MEHAVVSKKNPALIVFAIDCSKSMRDANQLHHASNALEHLRNKASSKPGQMRLTVFTFTSTIIKAYSGPMENAPRQFQYDSSFEQTHLKKACEAVKEEYYGHLKNHCSANDPLVNILFFTDGGHTPGLDLDDLRYMEPSMKPNKILGPIADMPNVVLSVIDYEIQNPLPRFPLSTDHLPQSMYKLSAATVMDSSVLETAYNQEKNKPPKPGESLVDIFGPMEELVDRRFIVNCQDIGHSPKITTAFIRLGTTTASNSFENDGFGVTLSISFEDLFEE